MIASEIDEKDLTGISPNEKKYALKLKRFSIASVILGLLGLMQLLIFRDTFFVLCSLNYILLTTGIVLGIAGMKSSKKITPIFGVILSSLSLLANAIFLFVAGVRILFSS